MIKTLKQTISNMFYWIKKKLIQFKKWLILIIFGAAVVAAPLVLPIDPPIIISAEYITAPENNSYKIGGNNYDSVLKDNIRESQSLKYQVKDKFISFSPASIGWDKSFCLVSTMETSPKKKIDDKKNTYKNAFVKGVDVNINSESNRWSKVVEIASLETLGEIPKKAEYLEVVYEVETNFTIDGWNKNDDFEITGITRLGDHSYIQPAMVWDSYEEIVFNDKIKNPDDFSEEELYEVLISRVQIKSVLRKEDSKMYLVKMIPVEWLKTALFPIYTDTDITYGTASEFESGETHWIRCCEIDTDKFVIAYQDAADAQAGKAVVATVSGTTITWGTISEFNADIDTTYYGHIGVCKLATNKFVVTYANDGVGDDLYGRVATVDGTTISWGSETVLHAKDYEGISCCQLGTDKFVVCGNNETDADDGHAIVFTVSNTTITSGTASEFCNYQIASSKCAKLDTDKFVVAWRETLGSWRTAVRVATVSGTTITWGATVETGMSGGYSPGLAVLDTDKFVVGQRGNLVNDRNYAVVGTVSTRTITLGSVTELAVNNAYLRKITKVDTTHCVIAYSDDSDSSKGKTFYCSVDFSARTITPGTAEEFESGAIGGTGDEGLDICLISSGKIVITFQDDADLDKGKAIIGDIAGAPPVTRRMFLTQ